MLGIQHKFLGRILGPLMKVLLPMTNNVLTPLTNNILIPLGLLTASAADAKIHDKILEWGFYSLGMTTLIISNKEMKDEKSSNLSKILAYW